MLIVKTAEQYLGSDENYEFNLMKVKNYFKSVGYQVLDKDDLLLFEKIGILNQREEATLLKYHKRGDAWYF
jgi:hypothetical protein